MPSWPPSRRLDGWNWGGKDKARPRERQAIRDWLASLQNRHLVWNRTQRSHIISLCLRACVCVGVPAHENVHCFCTFMSGCMCVGLSVRLYLVFFLCVNEHLSLSCPRVFYHCFICPFCSLGLTDRMWLIRRYFSQRANFGDVCLHLLFSLSFFLIILFFQLPAPSLAAQSHLKEHHRPYKIFK